MSEDDSSPLPAWLLLGAIFWALVGLGVSIAWAGNITAVGDVSSDCARPDCKMVMMGRNGAQDWGDLPPPDAPGVIASTDQAEVCGYEGGLSYSKRHRQTTPEMKAAAHRGQRYCGEIDHRLPLALGGADDVHNLWCQPAPPEKWNFKIKDRLEAYVWRAVCKEHSMTLAEGQAVFLEPDWRAAYCKFIGGAPCPP